MFAYTGLRIKSNKINSSKYNIHAYIIINIFLNKPKRNLFESKKLLTKTKRILIDVNCLK